MLKRKRGQSDGTCFARSVNGCKALSEYHENCGTYGCPFYKPLGCKDWIKLEQEDGSILMYEPEELEIKGKMKGNAYEAEFNGDFIV